MEFTNETRDQKPNSEAVVVLVYDYLYGVSLTLYVAAFHPLQAHTSRNADYDLISKSGFYASATDKTQTV